MTYVCALNGVAAHRPPIVAAGHADDYKVLQILVWAHSVIRGCARSRRDIQPTLPKNAWVNQK